MEEIRKLRSNDGVIFEIRTEAAKRSKLLNNLFEDIPSNDEIPINNVDSVTLQKVVEFLEHYSSLPITIEEEEDESSRYSLAKPVTNEWDNSFLQVDLDLLMKLLLVMLFFFLNARKS